MAGAAAIAGLVVGAGAGSPPAPSAEAALPAECAGGDGGWRRLAGQRILVRSDGTADRALLRRVRRGEIAGVIVFPPDGAERRQIGTGLRRIQEAAAAAGQPPALVATDQEGGPVERFPDGPPLRSPLELGQRGDEDDARLEGQATGSFLRRLGVNVDLAPVLDVPVSEEAAISPRTFGDDARTVSRMGLAFAAGLGEEGVLATAKHFPGFGRSLLNTDLSPSEIDASRRDLRADLRPFRDAIAAGVPLVMLANASYPALGGSDPASLDAAIATELLRERLGFQGVSITDDLEATAVSATLGPGDAAEQAADAGADLLLFATTRAMGVHEQLARAMARGRLDLAAAREACARVVELRRGLD